MTPTRTRTAALFAALLLFAGCGSEPPPQEEVLRPVRFTTVYAGGAERTRVFSGVARAGVESNLSFKVPGLVRRVDVEVGDRVRAGQLIAEIEPTDYELQVQDAEASLAQARSQARNAQSSYERMQALYENNSASRAELDASRSQMESTAAQVASIEKKLELARLQLSYTTLRAPLDGAIAQVPVDVNENVDAGRTVAVLTAGERPEVEVAIPEVLISSVRDGQKVSVSFDALADERLPATVTEVGVSSSGFATTYPVKVRLDSPDQRVRPGMAAEVSFSFAAGAGGEHIVLPPIAVGEDEQGRFVWVLEDRGDSTATVTRRAVTVGELTSDGLEIRSGLEDGERVVTAGVTRIHEGQKVRASGEGM